MQSYLTVLMLLYYFFVAFTSNDDRRLGTLFCCCCFCSNKRRSCQSTSFLDLMPGCTGWRGLSSSCAVSSCPLRDGCEAQRPVSSSGTLEPLVFSVVISAVCEYVASPQDYAALLLVNRCMQCCAKRYCVHVEIPASAIRHRVFRKNNEMFELIHRRPIGLWLDHVGSFTNYVRHLTSGHGEAPRQPQRRRDLQLLDADAHNDLSSDLVTSEARQPASTSLADILSWPTVLRCEPYNRRRVGAQELSPSTTSTGCCGSGSCQLDAQKQVEITPRSIVITNRSAPGYDSDGVTHHLQLDAGDLPLFPSALPLFGSVTSITISHYADALYLFLGLWTGRQVTYDDDISNPSLENAEKESNPFPSLESLHLVCCSVTEASLTAAVQCKWCPRSLSVRGQLAQTSLTTTLGNSRSPNTRQRPEGEGSGHASLRALSCRSLILHSLSTFSVVPAAVGLKYLRLNILEALEPSAWETMASATLVRLHIGDVSGDPQLSSLDLNLSRWSSLGDVYIGQCKSVTSLIGSPSLLNVHLHRCVFHFRGTFVAPNASVELSECVGASPRIEFHCKKMEVTKWCGKPPIVVAVPS